MKLHFDQLDGQHVTGYGPGWIAVNGIRYEEPLLLGNDYCKVLGVPSMQLEDLTAEIIEAVIAEHPAVVVVGTGRQFALAPAQFNARFIAVGIGVETMDTRAACRTHNILVGEGRQVVTFLFH